MYEQLNQMYKLAIWDKRGCMWMPIYGQLLYQQIIAYAPAKEAIGRWSKTWLEEEAK